MVHIGCHRWKHTARLAYAYSKRMRDWQWVYDDDWMHKDTMDQPYFILHKVGLQLYHIS